MSAAMGPSEPTPAVPTPAAPSQPAKPRRNQWVVIGAIVAVIVILLAVVLVILPSLSSSSSSGTSEQTFSQAAPIATSVAQGTSGGSWQMDVAGGILSNVSFFADVGEFNSIGCAVTPLGGSSNATVPATASNQTNGATSAWLFFFYNSSTNVSLLVTVFNGHGSALAKIDVGPSCAIGFVFQYLSPVSPSAVIDSSAAASAVQQYAGSFLASHPRVTAAYSLLGGVTYNGYSLFGPEWDVNYTTCPASPTPGETGSSFNSTVNAETGRVLSHDTHTNVDCVAATSSILTRGTPVSGPVDRAVAVADLAWASRRT